MNEDDIDRLEAKLSRPALVTRGRVLGAVGSAAVLALSLVLLFDRRALTGESRGTTRDDRCPWATTNADPKVECLLVVRERVGAGVAAEDLAGPLSVGPCESLYRVRVGTREFRCVFDARSGKADVEE